MSENAAPVRFKPDMPNIPGVSGPSGKPPRRNPLLPLIIGLLALGLVFLVAIRWLSRTKPVEVMKVEPPPQIEVPAPRPDPAASLAHATENNPYVADVSALSKPWSSVDFFIRNPLTGETLPATVIRLPMGSASQSSGYWGFSLKAPYGACLLEYITDMNKLRDDYGYRAANHPLVGNPCSHNLYDPLKTTNLPGNIWIRGAIVQGSDIRPPFGVEIEVRGKDVLAVRTE